MRYPVPIMLLLAIPVLWGAAGCCSAPKLGVGSVSPGQDHVSAAPSQDSIGAYVYGEVKQPGAPLMWGAMTVWSAIASTGGFTPSANRKMVQVTRHDGELHVINIQKKDEFIYPGDHIY